MQVYYKGFGIRGFKTFLEMGMKYYQVKEIELSEIAKFKLAVIGYYHNKSFDKKGNKSIQNTALRFGLHRNTISNYLKQFDSRNLQKLEPKSTAPKNTSNRKRTSILIENEILKIRDRYPYYGKEKLKERLKIEKNITISPSKIGDVLKEHNRQYEWRKYESSCNFKKTIKKRNGEKKRLPKIKAKKVGEIIQIDTVIIQWSGSKIYVINAIDVYSRIAISYAYKNPSSANAKDFLLNKVLNFFGHNNGKDNVNSDTKVEFIQTDNGSEFHKYFDLACRELNIKHVWTYPNTPKMNSYIEKYNCTIQIECLERKDAIRDIRLLNKKIYNYLIEYNTIRPHQSLNYLTPIDILIQSQLQSIKPDYLNPSMHNMLSTSSNILKNLQIINKDVN